MDINCFFPDVPGKTTIVILVHDIDTWIMYWLISSISTG